MRVARAALRVSMTAAFATPEPASQNPHPLAIVTVQNVCRGPCLSFRRRAGWNQFEMPALI